MPSRRAWKPRPAGVRNPPFPTFRPARSRSRRAAGRARPWRAFGSTVRCAATRARPAYSRLTDTATAGRRRAPRKRAKPSPEASGAMQLSRTRTGAIVPAARRLSCRGARRPAREPRRTPPARRCSWPEAPDRVLALGGPSPTTPCSPSRRSLPSSALSGWPAMPIGVTSGSETGAQTSEMDVRGSPQIGHRLDRPEASDALLGDRGGPEALEVGIGGATRVARMVIDAKRIALPDLDLRARRDRTAAWDPAPRPQEAHKSSLPPARAGPLTPTRSLSASKRKVRG